MKSWIQWRMQGRGPGGPGPPLFLDQTENIFFGDRATILSKGLDDRPPPISRSGSGSVTVFIPISAQLRISAHLE